MPDGDIATSFPMGGIVRSLPLDMMFKAPLEAAIQAQGDSAKATVAYMKDIGFDKDGKLNVVRSGYNQVIQDGDGKVIKTVQRVVDAPLLALVPIPALQIKSVDVDFELTVETSESTKSSQEYAGSLSGKVGWGFFSCSFSASVACKSEQTRKTDTRARYAVKIHAEQCPPPEGFMRIIDTLMNAMMQPIDADKAPKLSEPAKPAPAPAPAN